MDAARVTAMQLSRKNLSFGYVLLFSFTVEQTKSDTAWKTLAILQRPESTANALPFSRQTATKRSETDQSGLRYARTYGLSA